MRSPREHLVGIATSPQGREFFSLRAEDELRMWLYVELCILGVNVSRYLEFLISLLRYPISALSTVQGIVGVDTYTGEHLFASSMQELETLGDCMRAERRAIALGCLIGASSFDVSFNATLCTMPFLDYNMALANVNSVGVAFSSTHVKSVVNNEEKIVLSSSKITDYDRL